MKTSPSKLAQAKVESAVKNGRLKKPDACQWCEKPSSMLHGHHRDYDKPLDVIWLCPPCHAKIHGKIEEVISSNLRRPKAKGKEERLTAINLFRSTEEERRQWDQAAQDAGITFSEWIRIVANERGGSH